MKVSRLCVFLLWGATTLLSSSSLAWAEKIPPLRWGPYSVRVKHEEDWDRDVLLIQDRRHRTLRTIQTYQIAKVRLRQLHPKERPVLHVITSFGAVHGGMTELLFTRQGRLRNILVFLAGNGELTEYRDLDGDGRQEIIAQSDVLAYAGMSFGSSPRVTMVLGWNGRCYVDRTRRYPAIARRKALAYQDKLKALRAKLLRQQEGDFDYDEFKGLVAGYYANLWVIGCASEARQWIKINITQSSLPKLYKEVPEMIAGWDTRLAMRGDQVITRSEKLMVPGKWYPPKQ